MELTEGMERKYFKAFLQILRKDKKKFEARKQTNNILRVKMQRLSAKEQSENIKNRPVMLKERHRTLLKVIAQQ